LEDVSSKDERGGKLKNVNNNLGWQDRNGGWGEKLWEFRRNEVGYFTTN